MPRINNENELDDIVELLSSSTTRLLNPETATNPVGVGSKGSWQQNNPLSVTKAYDGVIRERVFVIKGQPSGAIRLTTPAEANASLNFPHNFLVLQVCVRLGDEFSFDIFVEDQSQPPEQLRLQFSTAVKNNHIGVNTARLSIALVASSQWHNLCVPLGHLIESLWPTRVYDHISKVTICANCTLRRVFMMMRHHTAGNMTTKSIDIPISYQLRSRAARVHTTMLNARTLDLPTLYGTDESRFTSLASTSTGKPGHLLNSRVISGGKLRQSRPPLPQPRPLIDVDTNEVVIALQRTSSATRTLHPESSVTSLGAQKRSSSLPRLSANVSNRSKSPKVQQRESIWERLSRGKSASIQSVERLGNQTKDGTMHQRPLRVGSGGPSRLPRARQQIDVLKFRRGKNNFLTSATNSRPRSRQSEVKQQQEQQQPQQQRSASRTSKSSISGRESSQRKPAHQNDDDTLAIESDVDYESDWSSGKVEEPSSSARMTTGSEDDDESSVSSTLPTSELIKTTKNTKPTKSQTVTTVTTVVPNLPPAAARPQPQIIVDRGETTDLDLSMVSASTVSNRKPPKIPEKQPPASVKDSGRRTQSVKGSSNSQTVTTSKTATLPGKGAMNTNSNNATATTTVNKSAIKLAATTTSTTTAAATTTTTTVNNTLTGQPWDDDFEVAALASMRRQFNEENNVASDGTGTNQRTNIIEQLRRHVCDDETDEEVEEEEQDWSPEVSDVDFELPGRIMSAAADRNGSRSEMLLTNLNESLSQSQASRRFIQLYNNEADASSSAGTQRAAAAVRVNGKPRQGAHHDDSGVDSVDDYPLNACPVLDLIFDPDLNCYFNPNDGSFYRIAPAK